MTTMKMTMMKRRKITDHVRNTDTIDTTDK
jgi:hypothetical protein